LTNHQTAAVVQCLAGVMERSFNDIENTTVKLNEQDKVGTDFKYFPATY
jgi:hypothetical protein